MNQYHRHLGQDNGASDSEQFFCINIDIDRLTVVMNMTFNGLKSFGEFIDKLVDCGVINEENILNVEPIGHSMPITKMILQKNLTYEYEKNLILNYSVAENTLYLLANDKGFADLKDSLTCLQESLECGKTDDISYMVDEWGGSGLAYKQFIEGADIVCHLRLYGII